MGLLALFEKLKKLPDLFTGKPGDHKFVLKRHEIKNMLDPDVSLRDGRSDSSVIEKCKINMLFDL